MTTHNTMAIRRSSLFGTVALCALIFGTGLSLSGCFASEEAVLIDDPPADSVVFWPATMQYARRGDTIYARIHGLKRRVLCSVPLQVGWNFRRDTTGAEFYRARSSFEIPAGARCETDAKGLDTLFRVRFYTRLGNKLYLETPEGVATDSLLFVAEDAPALVSAVHIRHAPGGADSTVSGRYTYFDSTATRPHRQLRIDALATCEVVQAAVFEKRQDTVLVKFRLIKAAPKPADQFPPCSGPRVDSILVVHNTFNFLP